MDYIFGQLAQSARQFCIQNLFVNHVLYFQNLQNQTVIQLLTIGWIQFGSYKNPSPVKSTRFKEVFTHSKNTWLVCSPSDGALNVTDTLIAWSLSSSNNIGSTVKEPKIRQFEEFISWKKV